MFGPFTGLGEDAVKQPRNRPLLSSLFVLSISYLVSVTNFNFQSVESWLLLVPSMLATADGATCNMKFNPWDPVIVLDKNGQSKDRVTFATHFATQNGNLSLNYSFALWHYLSYNI